MKSALHIREPDRDLIEVGQTHAVRTNFLIDQRVTYLNRPLTAARCPRASSDSHATRGDGPALIVPLRPDQPSPDEPGMIPLSIPEIKRLLAALTTPGPCLPGSSSTGMHGPAATRPEPGGSTNAPDSPAIPRSPWSASEMRLPR